MYAPLLPTHTVLVSTSTSVLVSTAEANSANGLGVRLKPSSTPCESRTPGNRSLHHIRTAADQSPDSAQIDSLLAGHYATQHAPLFRLPPELFDEIYIQVRESSGAYDARLLLLALTCKTLLACARRHIVRLQTRKHAPLAGHRLLCVGDAAKTVADYPRGLLRSSETETMRASQSLLLKSTSSPKSERNPLSDGPHEDTPLSLYEHASARWRRYCSKSPSSASVGMAGLADLLYRPSSVSRMSGEDFALFRALTAASYGPNAEAGPWVVCNLSKHEYVHARADGLNIDIAGGERSPWSGSMPLPGEKGNKERERAALWHLLLVQMCWSASPIVDTVSAEELCRGRWAGDRFAIMPLERLASDDGEEWHDVTESAVRMARLLRGL